MDQSQHNGRKYFQPKFYAEGINAQGTQIWTDVPENDQTLSPGNDQKISFKESQRWQHLVQDLHLQF